MKFYSYIWNERGTSKEQGAKKYLDFVLAWAEDEEKWEIETTANRIYGSFYRSVEGEIVLSISGSKRVRIEDKRK